MNRVAYKTVFPLLKDNIMWLWYNSVKGFIRPNGEIKTFGNKLRYTNLDIKKRHENLILYKSYHEEEYPQYDNYDAIEVSKVDEIPLDYDGVMGVPITFLWKYNPDQFEIIWLERYTAPKEVLVWWRLAINWKPTYARILIRRKK